jgi:tetratricopeptide (TPR) repeat protein
MISVVPVVNQTGYQELAPYRLALTYALIQELAESPRVRPLDYGRVAQFVEPAIVSGSDVSNRDVQRAMADQGRARWLVVPTLLHENGAWRARADVQEASTGSTVGRLETEAIASSLTKDAAYSRIIALADLIEQHFALQGGAARPSARPLSARLRTLDAVQALESGLAAMERLEYAAAREAFARAATLDGRHPLPQAWLSRVEQVLRRPDAAGEAADRAARLVTDDTPVSDALVARAVWATARQDFPEAESLYKELATRFPDEPRWQGELASFYERQGRLDDAVAIYQRVRGTPLAVPRFDLDLCRLYARRDDLSRAREHAALAIAQYREMGFKSGEAQARLCEADVLRLGGAGDRGQALGASFDALGVFDALGEKFNEARAHHYVARGRSRQLLDPGVGRGAGHGQPGARRRGAQQPWRRVGSPRPPPAEPGLLRAERRAERGAGRRARGRPCAGQRGRRPGGVRTEPRRRRAPRAERVDRVPEDR